MLTLSTVDADGLTIKRTIKMIDKNAYSLFKVINFVSLPVFETEISKGAKCNT